MKASFSVAAHGGLAVAAVGRGLGEEYGCAGNYWVAGRAD